CLQTKHSMFTF
nr:immunoglobulin light chain junction region [Macaca mulatta]MOX99149.1 immunoglobulin light chain junction region [Macaca mulatta]MOX99631.1 immunoglobulin light chain junction region [Macaca mulatta]MOY00255.1 immunoglobulin light chain junction region [Macaca mulatta]MOY01028.1 immunoglobulin light chain junction region [Macaca mulatta]